MFFSIYIIFKGKKDMNLLETKRMKASMEIATNKVNSILINEDFKKTVRYTSFALLGFTALSIFTDFSSAANYTSGALKGSGGGAAMMPWETFLDQIVDSLTGKTAKILATLGLIISAIGLFMGNLGDGIKKIFIILVAVCIAIWAPSIIGLVTGN